MEDHPLAPAGRPALPITAITATLKELQVLMKVTTLMQKPLFSIIPDQFVMVSAIHHFQEGFFIPLKALFAAR